MLVRLDPVDAELAVAQAQAGLAQAEAQLARLLAGPRDTDLAVAAAQVAATSSVVTQTLAQRDRLYSGTTEAQIAADLAIGVASGALLDHLLLAVRGGGMRTVGRARRAVE